MKTKTMKKVVAMFSMVAVSVATMGLSVTVAATPNIGTNLTSDTSGGAAPIVKAKWEANVDRYTDALTDAGAQFMPSGQYQVNTTIAICAIVTDPDGLADVNNVYADVFYPENIAVGDSHVKLPTQDGSDTAGCGVLMQEDVLTRLDKAAGIELFCDLVRNNNNNLPTFNPNGLYDYDEICGETGELEKDTAAVYCGEKEISYEDPSGDYEVWAVGQDANGLQGILENHFTYLPLTAFETDFSTVSYGNVRLNTHKIIPGDLTWDAMNQGKASVRNVGNTRLAMNVRQDDMGLGTTSGVSNVIYDARVGSDAPYAVYNPEVTTPLLNYLGLSELNEMDFSVEISKFPPTHTGDVYIGEMVLTATFVEHLECCVTGC
ncbi:MAG: hypothetical protein KAI71_06230 [Candidatus Pacebacteria bacterium]|nr:hypothetical protein [Candidatus Paceibacterota bacterium]